MAQSALPTSKSVWERYGKSHSIGSECAFSIGVENPIRTKPFGLIRKDYNTKEFIAQNRDNVIDGRLLLWARITDLKIDRRGRVYPIVEPITSFDRDTLERCGADDLLRKENP